MKVRDCCCKNVEVCGLDANLASAGWKMWERDCGILPVIDEDGLPVGVVTDRDICIAASTKYRPAAGIPLRELLPSRNPLSCGPDDDVKDAMATMKREKVRRLLVTDADGRLKGVLSLNDLVLAAKPTRLARPGDISSDDILLALKAICEHGAPEKKTAPLILLGVGAQ